MSDPIKHDHEKKIEYSIQRIESFHKEHAFKILKSNYPISEALAVISKNEKKGFTCKIILEKLHGSKYNNEPERYGFFDEIILESSGYKYVIPKKSTTSVTLSLTQPQIATLQLNHFHTGTIDEYSDKIYRLIIPTEVEPEFDCFEFKSLKIKDSVIFSGLLEIIIDNYVFHIFRYKNDDNEKKYLIIDCLTKITFQNFKENTDAIILAIGFITGNLFLDEYYYEMLDETRDYWISSIYCQDKGDSILTQSKLLDPFRFKEYLDAINRKDISESVGVRMPARIFSNLCLKIRDNTVYSRCCKLLIEGNQTSHLLLRAGIYSIAIETLTGIIYNENAEKLNPISDSKLVTLIQNKIRTVIKEYDEHISEYGKAIIESKINDLNRPTNSKKLSTPFEIYNIKLSKEDLDILNHRNKFLHGTSPFNENELKDKEKELAYVVSRLRFMLCSLMLKYVDYRGHLINHPAWIQYNTGEKVTDHLFKVI